LKRVFDWWETVQPLQKKAAARISIVIFQQSVSEGKYFTKNRKNQLFIAAKLSFCVNYLKRLVLEKFLMIIAIKN